MEKFKNQARKRFESLWETEGGKLLRANIIPSAMKDGEIYPTDYCISTIARLIQQPNGAEIVCGIRNALSIYLKQRIHNLFIRMNPFTYLYWDARKEKIRMNLIVIRLTKSNISV